MALAPATSRPVQARRTVPFRMMSSATRRTRSMGMAKPSPIDPPPLVKMEDASPITSPDALASGPPEFPGLMAASVWIMSRYIPG
jgi:hypothetical protein